MKNKKYYDLYISIKNAIVSGQYSPNEKLPSKRVTADIHGLSPITVERAYAMLSDEGYIYTKERSGYYVSDIDGFESNIGLEEAASIQHLNEKVIVPASHDLEYSLWFKALRKVISEREQELFVKSPNMGCAVLRNAIADYLYRYRGMTANPRRIIIGSGAEQLYETVVKIIGRDRIYGIEDPSYSRIEEVYIEAGANICPLKFGRDGIESAELSSKEFDILHVTPFHSYPSGVSTSISKRYEYLKWAERSGNYIVEDDFASEFFTPGHPIEPLYCLDTRQSVIYINTFSKSISPSIRIGYMILPEALIPEYKKGAGRFSCSVPVLDQYVLAEFISSGSFERHLNRMRRKMRTNKK